MKEKFPDLLRNCYGAAAEKWLELLPHQVQQLALRWTLTDLVPLENLTYHYVLKGMQGNQPIILKIGMDEKGLQQQAIALREFENFGGVKLLATASNALLLERVTPGNSLKTLFPQKEEEALQIVCQLMDRLHRAPVPKWGTFPTIEEWLNRLFQSTSVPSYYVQKAQTLSQELLTTIKDTCVLHGDLHHENILLGKDEWKVIDPQGVIGEPAIEIGAYMRNPLPEILETPDITSFMARRVERFAAYFAQDSERLKKWSFVQSVLCWVWMVEDNNDPSSFQQLTEIFDQLLEA